MRSRRSPSVAGEEHDERQLERRERRGLPLGDRLERRVAEHAARSRRASTSRRASRGACRRRGATAPTSPAARRQARPRALVDRPPGQAGDADRDAEQHRAVHVGPDDEHREHEQRSRPHAALGLSEEDPDQDDEQRVGEALRARLGEEQALDERRAERDDHRDRRGAAPDEERREQAEGQGERDRAGGADGRVPTAAPELVEGQVREPLLVDPGPTEAGHGQAVDVRQPVRCDLPAGRERDPRIRVEDPAPRRGDGGEHEGRRGERPGELHAPGRSAVARPGRGGAATARLSTRRSSSGTLRAGSRTATGSAHARPRLRSG